MEIVKLIFSALDEAGVPWAVLRGAESLPDYIRYDIDILIGAQCLEEATLAVKTSARAAGWSCLVVTDKFHYRCCLLVSNTIPLRYLPIDLFEGCYFRNYPYADSAYALSRRTRNARNILIVPPGFGAAECLIKELLRHDTFKENSRVEVQAGSLIDRDTFIGGIVSVLGMPLAERMLIATQAGEWSALEIMAPEIRSAVKSQWAKALMALPSFLGRSLRHHYATPLNYFVVLLGPDGSGKSTVASRVAMRLFHHPFKVTRRFEHRFGLLPELKIIVAKIYRQLGRERKASQAAVPGTLGSGMNPDHNTLRAMIYVTYYWLDYVIGHLKIRHIRGQGGLIVFSRYFYDYGYQRGYANLPHIYFKLLQKFIPRPDIVFYLHRDADQIYADKPELDISEIQRQQDVIIDLIAQIPQAQLVDATMGLEATVDHVAKCILTAWHQRVGLGATNEQHNG